MQLHSVDVAIIVAYLLTSVLVGYWVSHRASRDLKAYFLGGNTMPWYVLGISNASGMFDISGTMLLVYWMFVYGLKSVWIPWLWPTFNQVFLMVFLSSWLRRSNAMTGAEWIQTRFGKGRGAQLAHIIVVIYAFVSIIGFFSYGFKGIGKFASTFLPWHLTPNQYALGLIAITTLYVIKGGMFSVVITEVMQFCILSIASFAVAIIAMSKVAPATLARAVPAGWDNLFFGWHLNLDWSSLIPSANAKIAEDGYGLFGFFVMMLLFKGVLISAAGPAPNYDMQRVLSSKNPREASMMSGWVNIVLTFPRYCLITGLTILAVVFFSDQIRGMGTHMDFELVLPYALARFVPAGLLGFLIAGLLAAYMSNFAATVNAAPPYFVNDIYKRFIFRGRRFGRRDRLVCRQREFRGAVDRLRPVGRLHGFQRPQVVLVALQRLRLLLGHGGRHHVFAHRARAAVGAARRAGVCARPLVEPRRLAGLPADFCHLDHRLPGRHAAHQARRGAGADRLLSPRSPVGLLGSGAQAGPRAGSRF
jgi:Na+/proline symporter